MGDIQMIVTDLDRTLLHTDKTISAYTAQVLLQCRQRGILVVFATARPFMATRFLRNTFAPDFVFANNGASLYQGETLLQETCICAQDTNTLLAQLLACDAVRCVSLEAGDCLLTNGALQFDGAQVWCLRYTDFSEGYHKTTPKISVDTEDLQPVADILQTYLQLHLYSNSGESWCMIMHKHATKLRAVQTLCAQCRIPIQNTVAFGDDYNDIGMLRACGTGVAMENAIEQAKQAADTVCPGNDADCVAVWLAQRLGISIN